MLHQLGSDPGTDRQPGADLGALLKEHRVDVRGEDGAWSLESH